MQLKIADLKQDISKAQKPGEMWIQKAISTAEDKLDRVSVMNFMKDYMEKRQIRRSISFELYCSVSSYYCIFIMHCYIISGFNSLQ